MPTRRDVLAGCAVVGGASALAGCSSLPFGGEDDDPSEYTDWIPDTDDAYRRFGSMRASDIAAIEGLPPELLEDRLLGVESSSIDQFLTLRQTGLNLLRTSLDDEQLRSDIAAELDGELEPRGDYEGYQRYGTPEADRVVAISDGVALLGGDAAVRSVVDAGSGAGERLVEANQEFELLTDALRAGHLVQGSVVGDPSNQEAVQGGRTATGLRMDVGAEDTQQTHVFVYQSESDVDVESVREEYEAQDGFEDVSASTDGRVATVEFTTPTDEI